MSKKLEWNIEKRVISDLIPHEENPRNFTDKGLRDLKKSINNIGYAQLVNINTDNKILSGHARVLMLKEMGYDEIDVLVPSREMTDKECKEMIIRMNANIAGVFDQDLLKKYYDMSELLDWGMEDIEVEEDGEPEVEEDQHVDPTEEEKEEVNTDIKQGDMFRLGEHYVLCGDSTKKDDVDRLMQGQKAQMVWTDPPYGVSYKGTNNPNGKEWEVIKNDKLRGDSLFIFLLEAFKNIKEYLEVGRAFYIWYANSNHLHFEEAINGANLKSKQVIIWQKGMVLGHSDYHWTYEPCFYGCHPEKNSQWFGNRAQKTLWNFQSPKEIKELKKEEMQTLLEELYDNKSVWELRRDNAQDYQHPTQKPIRLAAKGINNSSQKGEVVLDLFLGSFSSLMACEQMGRKARGMELDPKYMHLGLLRWQAYTGQPIFKVNPDGTEELYEINNEQNLKLAKDNKND